MILALFELRTKLVYLFKVVFVGRFQLRNGLNIVFLSQDSMLVLFVAI